MNTVYAYILSNKDGGMIHAQEFAKAYLNHCGDIEIVSQPVYFAPTWVKGPRIFKKVVSGLIWLSANVLFLVRILWSAGRHNGSVVLIRHNPNLTTMAASYFCSWLRPVVLEVNAVNGLEGGIQPKLRLWGERQVLRRARRLIVVSSVLREFLIEKGLADPDRIAVIPNGVDGDRFSPAVDGTRVRQLLSIPPERMVVGFVGNFKPWHGVGQIIAIAERCADRTRDLSFLVVGDGPEREAYETRVRELGLQDMFIFTGRITHEEVPSYLASMDVLLSPHVALGYESKSGFHGSPLKLFEYMAMGRAIIASPLGQIAELISDGKDGILLPAEEAERIARQIAIFQQDRDEVRRLGTNVRAKLERHYTWQANARSVQKVLQEAI